MRYYITSKRITIIKKKKSFDKNVKKLEVSFMAGENEKDDAATVENRLFFKVKHRTATGPFVNISKRSENKDSNRHLHTYIYFNIIHNS